MTIREAQIKYKQIEIDILLEHVLKKPKEYIFSNPNKKLSPSQKLKIDKLAKQRIKGIPIAYIVGYKYFYGKKFQVTKDTLIPRPETEQLIDLSVATIHTSDHIKSILDLGTGSGCIAVTLSCIFGNNEKKLNFSASDISLKALNIAKKNSKTHKHKIKFYKSNLFSNIDSKFDLIVANLPYVPLKDYEKLKHNLKFEPKTALTDGTNKAGLYEKFFKSATKHLNDKAVILLEIDPSTTQYISKYSKKHLPKSLITYYKDLSKRVRFAEIKLI